jgi:predicted phage terminase large subunit-like protein
MALTLEESKRLEELLKEEEAHNAKSHLLEFTKYMFDKFIPAEFHKVYYEVLNMFANGIISNLIITMPPQHGKSTGSTMYLPAYLFGLNPDLKIAISSYSTPITQRFNRQIQRIIDSKEYKDIFPNVTLGTSNIVTVTASPLRNASEFEIVDSSGGIRGKLMSVGRGGALTSQSVDIWIGDDLYKDYEEGNSPVVRDGVWNWYVTVPVSRQPKQKLKVFTRWHEDDSIGRIEKHENVVLVDSIDDIYSAIDEYGSDVWIKINFEAIKNSPKSEFDNREQGEALWENERPLKNLKSIRALDPEQFQCLYQGNPRSKEGLLYGDFKTYTELPQLKIKKNYTDTADAGTDYLCSINYGLPLSDNDNNIYILDMLYTQKGMTDTEPMTASLLNKGNINKALFESNNGGRYFSQNVQKHTNAVIDWFHQSKNKESRIFSNSASVSSRIVFPQRWSIDYADFYDHVTGYKKMFKANKYDDGPDVLTGIIEEEENNLDDFAVEWN